jgi:hypothetical protein
VRLQAWACRHPTALRHTRHQMLLLLLPYTTMLLSVCILIAVCLQARPRRHPTTLRRTRHQMLLLLPYPAMLLSAYILIAVCLQAWPCRHPTALRRTAAPAQCSTHHTAYPTTVHTRSAHSDHSTAKHRRLQAKAAAAAGEDADENGWSEQ